MTDYGRGPDPEPWHPEDPRDGDQGWAAQQATDGTAPYDGQQQYPRQPPDQRIQPLGPAGYGSGQDPYQQQYQEPRHTSYGGRSPYGDDQYDAQRYGDPRYAEPRQPPYGDQQSPPQQPAQQYGDPRYNGGWDNGQQAAMPYNGAPSAPYGDQPGGYPGNQDYYGTPDAYPPPQPPGERPAEPEPRMEPEAPPVEPGSRPEPETHPFFTGDAGRDGNGGDDGPGGTGGGSGADGGSGRSGGGGREHRGRSKKKKKSRNGTACLVVAVVLIGGAGGLGYAGHQFWQSKFGAPPDFAGSGSGAVQVEIPPGAGGYEIAAILVKNGVVKSQDAFVSATKGNPKGNSIQAGVYTLSKEMSAESAVTRMLNPSSHNAVIVPPGTRNVVVYEAIDKQIGAKVGTTAAVAKKEAANLGLPEWAKSGAPIKDPLEGFLYPASYPVAKGAEPAAVLKKMVARANAEYGELDLAASARKLGLDGPWEMITVASLVQAEGKTHDDFRKMAEVVYNRLKPGNQETNQLLQFDSAFNYLKGQSKIDISESEINSNQDPYNTYTQKGLTPGPIGNPGDDALKAALNPTEDGWIYFVATDGQQKTEFAKTYAGFQQLKDKFNDQKGNG
jgi:UPF0755 protein